MTQRRPDVESLSAGRARFTQPAAPGLSVSWPPPDMSKNQSGETDLTVEGYELRYKYTGASFWTSVSVSRSTTSTVLRNLAPNKSYRVDARVRYSGNRYPEWTGVDAPTTNTPAEAGGGQPQSHVRSPVGRGRLRSENRRRFHGPRQRLADLHGLVHACRHSQGHDRRCRRGREHRPRT